MTPIMSDESGELRERFLHLFNAAEIPQEVFLVRLFEAGPPKLRALR